MAAALAQSVDALGRVFGTEAFQPLVRCRVARAAARVPLSTADRRFAAGPAQAGVEPRLISGFLGWVLLAISLGDTGGVLGGLWFGAVWIALGHALWTHLDSPAPDPLAR
jgi:hypothetical protein